MALWKETLNQKSAHAFPVTSALQTNKQKTTIEAVCERERARERDRQTDRQTDGQADTETDTDRETQRDRD